MTLTHRLAATLSCAALAGFGLAACDGSASSQQAKSDAAAGVNKTAEGLGNVVDAAGKEIKVAADKAKPAAEQAAADAKVGVHKLAVAGAKVVDKTGDAVEKAGDHAQAHADKVEARNPPAQ